MNMKKLRKKHNLYRCLKAISYLLGFPLFIVMTIVGSMCLFGGDAYTDVKWNGIIACVIMWAISVVVQIIISLITKNYNARTLVVLIASVIMVIGGAVLCDLVVSKKYDEIADKYAEYGVELDSYKHDVGWISTWTGGQDSVPEKYAAEIADFTRIYNIEYKSSVYGGYNANKGDDIAIYRASHDGKKDGMTEEDFVLSRIEYNKEDDAYYSVNGMYADGYVFGYKQALKVLINYHQSKFDIEHDKKEIKDADGNVTIKYVANGKNADELLNKAYADMNAGKNAEWNKYTATKEWQDVYGPGGKAYSYCLSDKARLDKLLKALGKQLGASPLYTIDLARNLLDGFIADFGISMDDVKNLSVDALLDLVNGEKGEKIRGLLSGLGFELSGNLQLEDLLPLLSDFYFYQYPTLKPQYAFIEDETLRTYAEAKYYGVTHGGTVGSVLIPTESKKIQYKKDGDNIVEEEVTVYSNIGGVLMGGGGYSADYAYTLDQLYALQAKEELAKYFPFMAARKYGYICGGIIAVMTVLFYVNKRKEDEVFEIIANGGRR